MTLDVAIRVSGAARSCAEHIAVLRPAVGAETRVLVTADFAGDGLEVLSDSEPLVDQLPTDQDEHILVYGSEELLGRLQDLPVAMVWMVLGPGGNPLRSVWRLRGAHSWLGGVRLGLLLEDGREKESLGNSPLYNTGRIAKILTLTDLAEPASVESEAVAPDLTAQVAAAVLEVEPLETEGADAEMETAALPNTEQALLTRYALVRDRRNLIARSAELQAVLSDLLKETFALRFAISPETASAFEELTDRLARSATEYRELVEQRSQVEAKLHDLTWLKAELEM